LSVPLASGFAGLIMILSTKFLKGGIKQNNLETKIGNFVARVRSEVV
tara:strand:- start:2274 stop:2414 length:141 start_codon:yes stop_codon:yes gene_type:complete